MATGSYPDGNNPEYNSTKLKLAVDGQGIIIAMYYTNLGNSDLNISHICMGFGNAGEGQHSWISDSNRTLFYFKKL